MPRNWIGGGATWRGNKKESSSFLKKKTKKGLLWGFDVGARGRKSYFMLKRL
jgi:hypothetical protein